MIKSLRTIAISSAIIGVASPVAAQTLHFDYSEVGGNSFSYDQLADPTPIAYQNDFYTEISISNFDSATLSTPDFLTYYNGTFYVGGVFTPGATVEASGPQIYSGGESAPVFAPGKFTLTDINDSLTGILTVTGVPEPVTWAMMLLGLGGVGAVMRSRRTLAATAA